MINKKILIYIGIILMIMGCVIYDLFNRRNAEIALKNSDTVVAIVREIGPGRGNSTIYVDYVYAGQNLNSNFSVSVDTFKIGEKLLLKVSKGSPSRYIEYLNKKL
ncbi:hypothetical protein [Mucilaginibacter psychrotolerans]|uniref:DUF3592 domain-containing protein n=1 Tax=Mucilaginibacter psychrotolerans TaxID=1524096 RepID=A0A4Y8S3T0_9SPHI|nr:hypothetical protein [Mucilaginibacter psychrotolerans]TFF33351.1 hypothetical protein E2R66_26190 [Mucilaginibacter psychrotolerans]